MPMKIATKRIPNIYELFYDKQGNLLSSPDVISFKAQDNYANVLLINLEDGIEDNELVLINFTPKNAVINYTTHWFYVRPLKKIREYIIEGENAPRTFSTYLYEVPRIVLNNYVRNTTVENEITIVKRYGLNNLGVFNNYSDLNNEHQANIEMFNSNGFAYVLNDEYIGSVLHKRGYYQVIEVSNNVYGWSLRSNIMNYGLEQKQYEVKTAITEAGYANVDNVPNVEGTVVEALWRDLTSVIDDTIDLSDRLDSVEDDLTQLDGRVDTHIEEFDKLELLGVKNLGGPDLDTTTDLGDGVYRLYNSGGITFDYNVYSGEFIINGTSTTVVGTTLFKIPENNQYMISYIAVSGTLSNGTLTFFANPPYRSIMRQRNENVNKQAPLTTETHNAFDYEISSGTTFHDYRFKLQIEKGWDVSPYTVPLQPIIYHETKYLEDEINSHTGNKNNPHEVTAEQVDTYVKTAIDNKDTNTLQEAKDYTYSQVEIDNKDTAIMNKANNLENANMFKDVNYNNVNGVLTFTRYDDTTKEIDLPLELLVESGYYDEVANELVLVLANGSEIRIPVGNLLTDLDAHNIRFNGSGTNYLTAKTEVESAVKELDTRVKTNADNVALKVSTNDIVNDLVSTDVDKPLSANQGKVLNDTTAKLAVSNVFTQPQQVPNATLAQHTTNLSQVETMFEMFKQQLRGYNLAIPDLEGKEYLGNGVYRLIDDWGITIDYNVFNGYHIVNGQPTGDHTIYYIDEITMDIQQGLSYYVKYEYISGSTNGFNSAFNYRTYTTPTLITLNQENGNSFLVDYEPSLTAGIRTDMKTNHIYDNLTFKVQVEKGDTATPYTVPGQIPQYKIVGEE